ncbi:glycosyltransferase [Frigoribacterium salinisoli]
MTAPASGRPLVGWYVHHHGAGHLTRLLAVRPHLDADVVVLSSLPAPRTLPDGTTWRSLPRDDDAVTAPDGTTRHPADPGSGADPSAGGLLHWAPLHHDGHAARLAALASWIGEARPRAVVVDVSVEVTLLVRLLGVPPVVVVQPGDRSDGPHALGWGAAARLVAPWPEGLHESAALGRVAGRVRHVGGISRHDGRPRPADGAGEPVVPVPGSVLVLPGGGAGGSSDLAASVASAAAATPGTTWTVLGADGWVDDPWPALCAAEVVVSAAGQNSVADLAAAGARAVVLPQERPFGEQRATATALAELGLAVVPDAPRAPATSSTPDAGTDGVGWPVPDAWPGLLARARALQPDWDRWSVDGAARRAAAVVAEVAS